MNFPNFSLYLNLPIDLSVCLRMKMTEDSVIQKTSIEYTHCLLENEMTEKIESYMQSTRLCQNQSTSDSQGWVYNFLSNDDQKYNNQDDLKKQVLITNQ